MRWKIGDKVRTPTGVVGKIEKIAKATPRNWTVSYLISGEWFVSNSLEFADEWKEYERSLKIHDWFYAFCDDHRVWLAGEKARERLIEMRIKLEKKNSKRAIALWNKYAPRA